MKIAFDRETAYDEVVLHAYAVVGIDRKVPRGFVRIRPRSANLDKTDVLPASKSTPVECSKFHGARIIIMTNLPGHWLLCVAASRSENHC